ncbi:phosphate transporter family protein, partial [Ostertagia ostertagi]
MAFLLGAGLGANDVSNTFGTSVGSGVVTIVQAYILASIFITLGSVLVGKKCYHITLFLSACVLYRDRILMPVSTTHAMVGSTLGFTLVLRGTEGVNWDEIYRIIASWFLSPALSGLISGILYLIVDIAVLRRNHPFECGLRSLPAFYFFVIAFNVLMVTWDGSKLLHFNRITFWGAALISVAIGSLAALRNNFVIETGSTPQVSALLLKFQPPQLWISKVFVPARSRQCNCDRLSSPASCSSGPMDLRQRARLLVKGLLPNVERVDDEKTIQLFSWIQIFTACFAGFAIGANDVSNAIAPVAALVSIYKDQNARQEAEVPIYVLLFGCAGNLFWSVDAWLPYHWHGRKPSVSHQSSERFYNRVWCSDDDTHCQQTGTANQYNAMPGKRIDVINKQPKASVNCLIKFPE